jgi:hypothetical protein
MNAVLLSVVDVALIKLAVFLFLIIVAALGRLIGKIKGLQPPVAQRPKRPEGGTVQEQIDEFLRRAQQRRVVEPTQPTRSADTADDAVAVELIDDTPVGGRVGRQVSQYMDTSEFGRRSAEMGGEVVQSDEQFTERVQHVFSGDVSTLANRSGDMSSVPEVVEVDTYGAGQPTLDALPVAGAGLGDLLGSSDNIVHAIIMTEILRRREWE